MKEMFKNPFTWRRLAVALAGITVLVSVFFIHALAGLAAQEVVYAKPPEFVAQYAKRHAAQAKEAISQRSNTALTPVTQAHEQETALVRDVFFADGSADELVALFSHPDKAQRVKVALAFSALNIEFTHDEASGFADKRKQFYENYAAHVDGIRNAHFEALIVSAAEQTNNHIPYTIAWMPGQGKETVEILAWSAQHHSDWWVRRFSVFFVAQFGNNDELATQVLASQTHDPEYRVRKEVLDQRIRRILGS